MCIDIHSSLHSSLVQPYNVEPDRVHSKFKTLEQVGSTNFSCVAHSDSTESGDGISHCCLNSLKSSQPMLFMVMLATFNCWIESSIVATNTFGSSIPCTSEMWYQIGSKLSLLASISSKGVPEVRQDMLNCKSTNLWYCVHGSGLTYKSLTSASVIRSNCPWPLIRDNTPIQVKH